MQNTTPPPPPVIPTWICVLWSGSLKARNQYTRNIQSVNSVYCTGRISYQKFLPSVGCVKRQFCLLHWEEIITKILPQCRLWITYLPPVFLPLNVQYRSIMQSSKKDSAGMLKISLTLCLKIIVSLKSTWSMHWGAKNRPKGKVSPPLDFYLDNFLEYIYRIYRLIPYEFFLLKKNWSANLWKCTYCNWANPLQISSLKF